MPDRKRILFLFSDTGGGHRSAAEAIIEALDRNYPQRYQAKLVDVLKAYAPLPFNRLPAIYPRMVRLPRAWGAGYRLSNGHGRARALTAAAWPYVRAAARRLVVEQAPDLAVSVHPILNAPVIKALGRPGPPFLTVVTDLVTTHALWYHRRVSLCLVPTEQARERALACGLQPGQVRVVGLPVSWRFCQPPGDRSRLRGELGWPADRPMVLLVGGGEGMGPMFETAKAIAGIAGNFSLAVVAGRNGRLRNRLEAEVWPIPTFIYGFERRMPEMMQAASLLVTKAGPGTIAEALNAGLPMVLYSRLPGQEDGNVDYVVGQGVGAWAPGPARAAESVSAWLSSPRELERAAASCRRIARPEAASKVAEVIDTLLSNLPRAPDEDARPPTAEA
jgi:1,2-diacylglycerol 3-beta-galactosyltransferase